MRARDYDNEAGMLYDEDLLELVHREAERLLGGALDLASHALLQVEALPARTVNTCRAEQ